MIAASWLLTGTAVGLILTGHPEAAFFLACVVLAVLILAPDPARDAARRRNEEPVYFRPHARRVE